MNTKLITLASLVSFSIFFSCSTNKKATITEVTPVNQNITFEKDIKSITLKSCGGSYCHHGSPSYWASYENIKKIVDNGELYEEVIDKKSMPKGGKLSQKDYNLIKNWLATGAKK